MELAELSAATSFSSRGFSQTLIAARGAGGAAYLLYVAEVPREAVLGPVEVAGLTPGDAISAAGGLYQRGRDIALPATIPRQLPLRWRC